MCDRIRRNSRGARVMIKKKTHGGKTMQSFQNGAPSDNTQQIRRLHPVVMPGNGAVSDRGAVVFAVRDAGPGRLYCRLAGEGGGIAMERTGRLDTLCLSAQRLQAAMRGGKVEYDFYLLQSVHSSFRGQYIRFDPLRGEAVCVARSDIAEPFCLTIWETRTPLAVWMSEGALLTAPTLRVQSLRLAQETAKHLSEYKRRGIRCLGVPFDVPCVMTEEQRQSLQMLMECAFAQEQSVLLTLRLHCRTSELCDLCRTAAAWTERGCGGFFVADMRNASHGAMKALHSAVREVSQSALLLGDEFTPLSVLVDGTFDCKMDAGPSEALLDLRGHRDTARFWREFLRAQAWYLPQMRVLLPLICEGDVPDWMYVLQYTLPGTPLLTQDQFSRMQSVLGGIRRQYPALSHGRCVLKHAGDGLLIFDRVGTGPSERLRIAVNVSDQRTGCVSLPFEAQDLISGEIRHGNVTLMPGESAIFRRVKRKTDREKE